MTNIRLINEHDYLKVAQMIEDSLSNSSFANFYPKSTIDEIKNSLDEKGVAKRASWTHFYVIEENNEIVACGAIGPYYGSEEESSLFSIFVASKYQGKGYGRKIIEVLEKDEYFIRAKRVERSFFMGFLFKLCFYISQKGLKFLQVCQQFLFIEKWDMSIKMVY